MTNRVRSSVVHATISTLIVSALFMGAALYGRSTHFASGLPGDSTKVGVTVAVIPVPGSDTNFSGNNAVIPVPGSCTNPA
jgi:hypothetical protein